MVYYTEEAVERIMDISLKKMEERSLRANHFPTV